MACSALISSNHELASIKVISRPMSSNHIRNFTFEQFFNIFKTVQLDISHFWLINSGFNAEGKKRYVHLILRGCLVRPLFGPHLVSIFEASEEYLADQEEYSGAVTMKTLWVHSLTDLRRNLFQFHDRLSFERSSYLVPFTDGELLIRLKSIRAFIQVPQLQSPSVVAPHVNLPSQEQEQEQEQEELLLGTELNERQKVKSLLNHHVQIMISYLNRELGCQSVASISILKDYVNSYCDELNDLMINNV